MAPCADNSIPDAVDRQLLFTILDKSGTPLFVKDRECRFVLVNEAFCALAGMTREEMIGKTEYDLYSAEEAAGFLAIDDKVFQSRNPIQTEESFTDSNNVCKTLLTNKRVIETATGELLLVGTIHDISELRATQRKLEGAVNHLFAIAHTDHLTGLSNRLQLETELETLIQDNQEEKTEFAVIFVDLNGFKVINDTAGHLVGDQILISCSKRLRNQLRGDSKIARVGGDEFLLLLPKTDFENSQKVISRIIEAFQQPICIEDYSWQIACSIGVSFYPRHGTTSSELIRNADFAMYEAKNQQRNAGTMPCSTVEFFRTQIGDAMDRRRKIERAVNFSEHNDLIEQHYQPIVEHHRTGYQIRGFESLARWELNEESISPDEFIPILDKFGGIVPLGYKSIESACRYIKSLDGDQYVSVNLSYKQVSDKGFCETVASIIKEVGIEPHRLALELTERDASIEKSIVQSVFEKLRRMGLKTMIDDFGSGYSNLGRIRDFPIDIVKIDKSLIHDLRLLKSVLSLVRGLGFTTIVEGIETEELARVSRSFGANMLQGYYFGHPQPADFDWNNPQPQIIFPQLDIEGLGSMPVATPFN